MKKYVKMFEEYMDSYVDEIKMVPYDHKNKHYTLNSIVGFIPGGEWSPFSILCASGDELELRTEERIRESGMDLAKTGDGLLVIEYKDHYKKMYPNENDYDYFGQIPYDEQKEIVNKFIDDYFQNTISSDEMSDCMGYIEYLGKRYYMTFGGHGGVFENLENENCIFPAHIVKRTDWDVELPSYYGNMDKNQYKKYIIESLKKNAERNKEIISHAGFGVRVEPERSHIMADNFMNFMNLINNGNIIQGEMKELQEKEPFIYDLLPSEKKKLINDALKHNDSGLF